MYGVTDAWRSGDHFIWRSVDHFIWRSVDHFIWRSGDHFIWRSGDHCTSAVKSFYNRLCTLRSILILNSDHKYRERFEIKDLCVAYFHVYSPNAIVHISCLCAHARTHARPHSLTHSLTHARTHTCTHTCN